MWAPVVQCQGKALSPDVITRHSKWRKIGSPSLGHIEPLPRPQSLCPHSKPWYSLPFQAPGFCLYYLTLYFFCALLSMPRKLSFLFGHLCSRGVPGILALDLLPNLQPIGSCLSLWSRKPLLLPAPTDWHQLLLISTSCLQPGAHSLEAAHSCLLMGGWEPLLMLRWFEKAGITPSPSA